MKITFLGCAGGRRVTFKQHRGSGGFLIEGETAKIHVDPGPGAFIRAIQAGIDLEEIDSFIITHRHLDHCADINTLIEAKTMGGWNPGGEIIAPNDALNGEDPVICKYHRKHLNKIHVLKENFETSIKELNIKTALKHVHHGVETYGLIFKENSVNLGYVTDGRFEEEILEAYKNMDVLIVNTTFKNPRELDHMCLKDAITIAQRLKPKLLILYHFGMEILRMGLAKAAEYVEENSKIKTIAAKEFVSVNVKNHISIDKIKLKNPIGFTPYWK